jgi:hypothetical protein
MTTNTLPQPGATARFDLDNGDSYLGEVVETGGCCVVVRNYSAWYEGADQPYSAKYFDDEARFAVNAKTVIDTF